MKNHTYSIEFLTFTWHNRIMNDDLNPKKQGNDARILNRQAFPPGKEIIRQGDVGQRAFYIDDGSAEVYVHEGNTKLKVADLKKGDIFGEMALITEEARSATVVAKDTCTITIIEHSEIKGRIERIEDSATKALIHVLVERLREATQGQLAHYKSLEDFQDRITGLVDRVHIGVDSAQRDKFRDEVTPLLENLQEVLDRYQK